MIGFQRLIFTFAFGVGAPIGVEDFDVMLIHIGHHCHQKIIGAYSNSKDSRRQGKMSPGEFRRKRDMSFWYGILHHR